MRLAALLLAVALCAAAGGVAQAQPEPSLQELLDTAEAVRSTDPPRFTALLVDLDRRAAEASPQQRQQLRYLHIYELGYAGRYTEATNEAVALFDEVDDPALKLRAGSLLVNAYAATRNFPAGLRYLDLTLSLVDRVHDPELRSHAWFAASTIYTQIGQFELARHYGERILAVSTVGRTRCFAGQQTLEAQYQLSLSGAPGAPAPPAADAVRAMIDACVAEEERLPAGFGRALLARTVARAGRRAEAIDVAEAALPQAEATRYPRLIGEIRSLLAELYLDADDIDRAEAHAREAVAHGTAMEYSLPLVQAHRVLYEVAMRRGDPDGALEQFRRYAEADKAYVDAVKARELAYHMVRHETQQKTQTIDLLNEQNRVLQLEQKVAQQSARNIMLLVALLVVLLGTIGYWAYRTKRTQVVFRQLAQTDGLTGVSNRHYFSRRANEALDACRKSGEDVALVMFDLDRFKAINDEYGHAVGDWVLTEVAVQCRNACRKNDLFGRIGGEEFAILLVGADHAAAAELAQTCRARMHRVDTADTGRQFRISASFGIATAKTAGYDLHALMARADEAMYRAKNAGRDRIEHYAEAT